MRTILALLAVLCAACRSAPSPRPLSDVIGAEALGADVERIEAILREGHPALDKYRTRAAVDSIFRALRDSTSREMTVLHFWQVTARAVAAFRDNHTSVFANTVATTIYGRPGRIFPFRLGWDGSRWFILASYGTRGVPQGSELVELNGVPADTFFADCAAIIPTDGQVATRAPRRIERDFDLTCGALAGLPPRWRIRYRPPGSAVVDSIAVPAISYGEKRQAIARLASGDTAGLSPASLEFRRDSSIAVLALRTFQKGDGFNPAAYIDGAFRRIRAAQPKALIIDLRGNVGGRDTYAAHLFRQIAPDTFTYYERRIINRTRFALLKGTDDWMINYMLWFIPKKRLPDGRVALNMAMDKPMSPAKEVFTGAVLVLVDGNSISTSSEFASVFRARGRGLVVGEESGSAVTGGTGVTVSVTLPHSGLFLNLPLMTSDIRMVPGDSAPPDRGIHPDIYVMPGIADRMRHVDVTLDSAVTLAARSAAASP